MDKTRLDLFRGTFDVLILKSLIRDALHEVVPEAAVSE
jgi:hypothetical protein